MVAAKIKTRRTLRVRRDIYFWGKKMICSGKSSYMISWASSIRTRWRSQCKISQVAKSWTESIVSSRTMLSKTLKTKRTRALWAEVTTARVSQTCKMNCYSVLRRGSLSSNWMTASKYARNTSKYTKIRTIGKRRWRLFWKSIRKVDSQPYRELKIIRNVYVMMLLRILIERIQIIKTIGHRWVT